MIVAIALHPDDWANFSRDDRRFMRESIGGKGKLLKDLEVPRGHMRVDVAPNDEVELDHDHIVAYKWDEPGWMGRRAKV